jgi:hypothetical protein
MNTSKAEGIWEGKHSKDKIDGIKWSEKNY